MWHHNYRPFLNLSLVIFESFSRSFSERSGFGGGSFDGNILEAIDGTSQWLLRSALRSRRARLGLILYALVLQVESFCEMCNKRSLTFAIDVGAICHRISCPSADFAHSAQARCRSVMCDHACGFKLM